MIVVADGTIASGQFAGASVVITWTWPALNPASTSPTVSRVGRRGSLGPA